LRITKEEYLSELKNCDIVPATVTKSEIEYIETILKKQVKFYKTLAGLLMLVEIEKDYYQSGENMLYGGIVPYKETEQIKFNIDLNNPFFRMYVLFPLFNYENQKNMTGTKTNTYIVNSGKIKDIQQLDALLGRKERNAIRKSQKNGIEIKQAVTESEISEFVTLVKKRYAELKSYHEIRAELMKIAIRNDEGLLLLGKVNDNLVGGNFILKGKNHWLLLNNASTKEGRQNCVNNLLYYETLKRAINAKVKYLDWGTTDEIDITHGKFKENMLGKKYPIQILKEINNKPLLFLKRIKGEIHKTKKRIERKLFI
jgi:hypothetical protein